MIELITLFLLLLHATAILLSNHFWLTTWHVFVMLQKRGFSHGSNVSKRKRENPDHLHDSSYLESDISICPGQSNGHLSKPVAHKRPKVDETNITGSVSSGFLPHKDSSWEVSDCNASIPGLHHKYLWSLIATIVFPMTYCALLREFPFMLLFVAWFNS